MDKLDCLFGDEARIRDLDEEVALTFSHPPPAQDLGMLDAKAGTVDLDVNGREFTIKQSPGLLQSKLAGGTTGAAVWQTSRRIAEWLTVEDIFPSLMPPEGNILELGAGVSGMVAAVLSPRVATYLATDQTYALKLLTENIAANVLIGRKQKRVRNVTVAPLDWESDDVNSVLKAHGLVTGIDMIMACDCVYNYALIEPFVATLRDACKLRSSNATVPESSCSRKPTTCLIAQQLRQPDVFEQWLKAMDRDFHLWHVPDSMLTEGLRDGSGFAVHVVILR